MVRVTILKDQKDICRGFETSGHAGYADKGQDIVCAAVSALTINTVNSLEQFTEETFSLDSDEKRGRIALRFSHQPNEAAALLLSSYLLGIQGIAEQYGTQYLSLEMKEVETC